MRIQRGKKTDGVNYWPPSLLNAFSDPSCVHFENTNLMKTSFLSYIRVLTS